MSDPLKTADQFEGISDEDRREIMIEIDRVAGENRIKVTDEVFSFTPQANGARFPIIVNIAGIVILAGGIALLSWFFRTDNTELRESGTNVVTAESRLIEEIRRETEQLLAQKESEIEQIQAQLASISDERQALAADIEERIAQREDQLRVQFESELEAERQRLISLNLSDGEIQERLADYAAVKELEYAQRLEQFRRQTEAEQRRLEEDLNTLEAQFSQTLRQATTEREQLVAESQARLTAMQEEFQAELAESEAQLGAAEAELARLSREQERADLVQGQIRGLYTSVNEAITDGDTSAARARLGDLRSLLNEESTMRIPALREQRPVDLFIVGSLESLISYEERFGNPETLQRLSDAASIQEINDLTTEAASAAAAGDTLRAGALYRQALGVIPSVSESYSYLDDVATLDDTDRIEQINAAAAAIATQAEDAIASEDWLGAIDEYARIFQSYYQSRYRQQAVTGIRAASSALAEEAETQQTDLTGQIAEIESERATTIAALTEAQNALSETEAQVAELQDQLAEREAQIARVQTGATTTAGAVATLETQIGGLESEIAAGNRRISVLNDTIEARNGELEETEAELLTAREDLATSQTEIAQAQVLIGSLRQELATLREGGATANQSGVTIDPETAQELARLRVMENDLQDAQALYGDYRDETTALAGAGTTSVEVLNARVALERFLSDQAMRRLFPDLATEVGRYDNAYLASGRENAFLDVADLLTELSFAETPRGREALLAQARADLAERGGAAAAEFISELAVLLEEIQ